MKKSPEKQIGHKTIRRITSIGILTAIALTIFVLESQIPPLVAIPGIKLGLANIVTLFALVFLSPTDSFIILILRVTMGSGFSGQIMMLAYSLTGGLLCLLTEMILLKYLPLKNLWAASIIGAIIHNTAQVAVAALITQTPGIFWYMPYLIIAAIITGAFIGLAVQFTISKAGDTIKKIIK